MKRLFAAVIISMMFLGLAIQFSAAERTKVRFLAPRYHMGVTGEYWKSIEEQFENENPNIDVVVEMTDWGNLHTKITTYLAGGNPPVLANIANVWLSEYVAEGQAEPLSGYLTEEFKDKFIPSLFHPTTAGALGQGEPGEIYGLPIAVSARAMYYNKTIFDKAGISRPPVTWPELKEVAKTIKEKVPEAQPFGIPMTTWEGEQFFAYFLWSWGGKFFNDEGKFVINSPEGVEALQFMVDLVEEGLTNPAPTSINRDDMQVAFPQGRISMFITGPWQIGITEKENPDLNYGVAEIPSFRKKITGTVTDSLVMFKRGKNKEAAWEFVKFMYQKEHRLQFDLNEDMLPELKAVVEPFKEKRPELKTFLDLLPYGKFLPLHPKWEEITSEVIRQIQLVLLGEKSAKEALDDCAKIVNEDVLS